MGLLDLMGLTWPPQAAAQVSTQSAPATPHPQSSLQLKKRWLQQVGPVRLAAVETLHSVLKTSSGSLLMKSQNRLGPTPTAVGPRPTYTHAILDRENLNCCKGLWDQKGLNCRKRILGLKRLWDQKAVGPNWRKAVGLQGGCQKSKEMRPQAQLIMESTGMFNICYRGAAQLNARHPGK